MCVNSPRRLVPAEETSHDGIMTELLDNVVSLYMVAVREMITDSSHWSSVKRGVFKVQLMVQSLYPV